MAEERPTSSSLWASAGTSPAGGSVPSMEEILASIRRILNEDEPPAGSTAGPNETNPNETDPDDAEPLTLTEDMLVGEPLAPTPNAAPIVALPIVPMPIVPARPETAPAPQSTAQASVPPPLGRPAADGDALLAPTAAASVGHLLRSVAAERNSAVNRGGPSIEDVVREELRPLLKEWIDQHLPPLVERLARSEIERVVGRALS